MATQARVLGATDPGGGPGGRRSPDTDPQYGQRCMAWVEAHGEELWPRYAGQWIAVDADDGLVSVAADLLTVMRKAQDRGYPLPLVMGVPIEPRCALAV
jgi:Family of unknown function (DUF5678)